MPSAEDREDFGAFLELLRERGLHSPLWNWHQRLHLCAQLPHLLHASSDEDEEGEEEDDVDDDDDEDAIGRMAVDFVGRVEHIQEDVAAVFAALGIEGPSSLQSPSPLSSSSLVPHENRQERRHYRAYYTSERQKRIVSDIYRRDIEFFGYSF